MVSLINDSQKTQMVGDMVTCILCCQGTRDGFGQRGSSSTEHQHTHKLSRDQGRVRSARLELDRASTHSHPVKGSGTGSVSEARARQSINTLTRCQGIRDGFGQRGSSSTEHQHTHILSRDQGRVRSARLELDRASTHSHPVKGSETGSVSEARARQSINTLTSCQGIRDGFGQRGSSSTEHQHTHKLSRDQGRVRSARLELDRASTHSHPVKGSGTGSVSEARARQSINTLTSCQGIRDGFGQRGSSSTEHQHTHSLSRDQGRVRSARLELDRASTHSQAVKGSGTGSVSEARARQSINTLTSCQGIRDGFGQRGSSSTEHQHTHILSRDQGRVRSARLELDRASTHSQTVKGSGTGSVSEARARQSINTLTSCQEIGTGSVSEARARQSINTLTPCREIRDGFGQRGSSSTEHQHTHNLSRDQGRVRSARLELDRASTHSQAVKGSGTGSVSKARARQSINTLTLCQGIGDGFGQRGSSSTEHQHTHSLSRDQGRVRSARLELDRASTHSLAVKGSGTGSVSKARARQSINTLTLCQGIRDGFGQRGSSSTEHQHTHNLSRDQGRVRSARLELDRASTHSQPVKGSETGSVSEARARQSINTLTACQEIRDGFGQRGSSSTEHQHTHSLSRDQGRVRSARLELDRASTHSLPVEKSGTGSVSEARARQSINTLTSCHVVRGNHLPKSFMI
ncbi:hypothetical protein BD769DRAFT_977860 [Suillus cothurnatus]|nr:hypothetical protein BD769DRAFT_977860 [Suillus cothurnatus]